MAPRRLGVAAFAALAALVAAGYAAVAMRPLAALLRLVPDDAFYYLQIARQLAAGHGSTFDGVNPASGYHPAWMLLLVPFAALVSSPVALLRTALVVGLLLHIAASALLVPALRDFMSARAALVGGLCWLANPVALLLALQGVESAVYELALVVVLLVAARHARSGAPLPGVALGAALALAFLGRTEAGILAAVTCLGVLLAAGRGRRLAGARAALVVGGAFTLGTLPWFAWCWWQTESPWQSSGTAKALWAAPHLARYTPVERVSRALEVAAREFVSPPWIEPGIELGSFPPSLLLAAAILPALVGPVLALRLPADHRRVLGACAWLLGAMVSTGVVYGALAWTIPFWYHVLPGLFLFVLGYLWIGAAIDAGELRRWARPLGVAAATLVLATSLLADVVVSRHPPELYPWQPDMLRSVAVFDRLMPPGASVACFNAGIPAFFGSRRVVNLDGVVNLSVLPYYRARNLERYFADEHLDYLADDTATLDEAKPFFGAPLRLEPLASVRMTEWHSERRFLWRVGPASAPQSPPPAAR